MALVHTERNGIDRQSTRLNGRVTISGNPSKGIYRDAYSKGSEEVFVHSQKASEQWAGLKRIVGDGRAALS